ncbi:hypothetical protein [Flavobacterium sp. WV_118_3]|jgi:hypothetical protein|uniref:hypothetical protein n=1 Tax=Flavobacterium sp. WV_118_3 TaxID=3151764 RepID=UPI002B7314F5|nr:hypothetical protein [Flavobacterium sp.]
MKTIRIPEGAQVKLQAVISSDAIVATNISLNDVIVRQSKLYKFSIDLGDISTLDNKEMSIVSSFFVPAGSNITPIFNTTQVAYTLLYNDERFEMTVEKQKITASFFIAYAYIKIVKS